MHAYKCHQIPVSEVTAKGSPYFVLGEELSGGVFDAHSSSYNMFHRSHALSRQLFLMVVTYRSSRPVSCSRECTRTRARRGLPKQSYICMCVCMLKIIYMHVHVYDTVDRKSVV